MEIRVPNILKKKIKSQAACIKYYGKQCGDKLYRRLSDLAAAETLEDVRYLPGKYHELTGDRKGQWACHLCGQFRLVFEPVEDPIPTDEDGHYVWIEIKSIELLEIVDYH